MRRKASCMSTSSQYPVTRHHRREWIKPERLPYSARAVSVTQLGGDVAIAARLAGRYRAGHCIHAPTKRGKTRKVQHQPAQVVRRSREQSSDLVNSRLYFYRRFFLRQWAGECQQTGKRACVILLGELHTGDATGAPSNAAAANRSIKQGDTRALA